MKRDKDLLEKRINNIGFFFQIKKNSGISSKRAIIELSEIYGVCKKTVTNDLVKFKEKQGNYALA